MGKTQKNTKTGVRPFFFCLAASMMILFGISVFFSSIYIGRAIADPTSGDEAFFIVQDSDGKRWTKLDGLSTFANEEFGGKAMLAPGSSGRISPIFRSTIKSAFRRKTKTAFRWNFA